MGDGVIGIPRAVGSPQAREADDPQSRALSGRDDTARPTLRTEQYRDDYVRGNTAAPRGSTTAPVPPEQPREVTPEESRNYLDAIRKGHRDPDRWRTAHPITEGLRNGAITQDELDSAIRSGEGALARYWLDRFGRGEDVGAQNQRFIDKGLERGDITRDEMTRATENRESYQTLEALRRGNGRIEPGSEPTDNPAIRRGIERGLFTRSAVEAANAEGERVKRESLY